MSSRNVAASPRDIKQRMQDATGEPPKRFDALAHLRATWTYSYLTSSR